MARTKLLLVFFFVTAKALIAQQNTGLNSPNPGIQNFEFKQLLTKDGLPGTQVFDIVEDSAGFLWMATDNGLCRYDGVHFKIYGANEGCDERSFIRLFIDSKHTLWVLSNNYRLYYFKGTRFHEFTLVDQPSWMDEDREGNFWIGQRWGKIYRLEANKIADSVRYKGNGKDAYTYMYDFLPLNRKTILTECFYGPERIVNKISTKIPLQKGKYNFITRFFRLKNGKILISNINGIFSYDYQNNSVRLLYPLHKNEVTCFYEHPVSGDLFAGSNNGVFRFAKGMIDPANCEHLLEGKSVLSVKKNASGFFWIGTWGNGVYYSQLAPNHFTVNNGLKSNIAKHIVNSGDSIYIFSAKGDISLIVNNKTRPFVQNIAAEQFAAIYSVIRTTDNTIYFSTKEAEVFYKLRAGHIERCFFRGGYLLSIQDRPELYSLSVFNGEIYTYPSKKKVFPGRHPGFMEKQHVYATSFLPTYSLGDTAFYSGVSNGVVKLTVRNGMAFYKKQILNAKVTNITVTDDGTILACTKDKGIAIIKGNTTTFVDESKGLISNACDKMYYHKPFLYVCTDQGLGIIKLDEKNDMMFVNNLSSNDYLLSGSVFDVLLYKNWLYVGTAEGVSIIPLNGINRNTSTRAYIESLSFNNRDTLIHENYELPYDINNIGFKFYGISYGDNGRVLYKYRLEGVESDFTYSFDNVIKYNSLLPGTYRFILFAKGSNGLWSSAPATLGFTILKPYWQKAWFIILTIAGILLLTGLLLKRYIRSVKQKEELRRRMTEGELKALRLHMNPHFIFNTLNSLQAMIVDKQPQAAVEYISKFSKLIRYILDEAKKNDIQLQKEIDFIVLYIEVEQLRLRNKFAFDLQIAPDIDPYDIHIPSMALQPFIENAIKHGLAGKTDGKGRLSISFTLRNNDLLHVCITDNGWGRKKKTEETPLRESTGISYTNERLKLSSSGQLSEEPVHITDLYTSDNTPAGTRVDIDIPIIK